jgi:hypothetical protein
MTRMSANHVPLPELATNYDISSTRSIVSEREKRSIVSRRLHNIWTPSIAELRVSTSVPAQAIECRRAADCCNGSYFATSSYKHLSTFHQHRNMQRQSGIGRMRVREEKV